MQALTVPLLLILTGAIFAADYAGSLPVAKTWPVLLVGLGLIQLLIHLLPRPEVPEPAVRPVGTLSRRGSPASLFLPLLLIGLGAVLLTLNFRAAVSLRELFAAYWPWILVCWGGVRVLELAVLRLARRQPPAPLGAGAVIVAILLVAAGSIVHMMESHGFWERWDFRWLRDVPSDWL